MNAARRPRLVIASAGTYHLPFDRLSHWMHRWLITQPHVRLVVQHGPSTSVAGAENVRLLPHAEFLDLCRSADAVVLQGGAGGVMDMRALDIVPIVVPRVPGDGEVVDDHQLVFSAEMERLGVIRRALTYDELARELDTVLAEPVPGREKPAQMSTPGAQTAAELMNSPIMPLPWQATIRRILQVSTASIVSRRRRRRRDDR